MNLNLGEFKNLIYNFFTDYLLKIIDKFEDLEKLILCNK